MDKKKNTSNSWRRWINVIWRDDFLVSIETYWQNLQHEQWGLPLSNLQVHQQQWSWNVRVWRGREWWKWGISELRRRRFPWELELWWDFFSFLLFMEGREKGIWSFCFSGFFFWIVRALEEHNFFDSIKRVNWRLFSDQWLDHCNSYVNGWGTCSRTMVYLNLGKNFFEWTPLHSCGAYLGHGFFW